MDVWSSLSGMIDATIVTGDPEGLLQVLMKNDIAILNFHYGNDLSVRVLVYRKDYRKLVSILKKRGISVSKTKKEGLFWKWKACLVQNPFLCS